MKRVGGTDTIKVNVRIIAATNKDLEEAVAGGSFREDLYYRVNMIDLSPPPLRDRADDIILLARYFIKQFNHSVSPVKDLSKETISYLVNYKWPGNIRELKNIIEHAMIISKDKLKVMPPGSSVEEETHLQTLNDVERRHIIKVLKSTGWRIAGENGAAAILGMKRTTLNARMKSLEIKRPDAG